MNKAHSPLGRLSRLLKIQKKKEALSSFPSLFRKPVEVKLDSFYQTLFQHLIVLDSGLELLDAQVPILEGASKIDLLACNPLGELILVWVFDRLSSENVSQLLPSYDWVKKNVSLWEHFYPQIRKTKKIRLKVWFFSRDINPEIKLILPYLKEIQLQLFHYRFMKKNGGSFMVVRPWGLLKNTPGPSSSPVPRPAPLNFNKKPPLHPKPGSLPLSSPPPPPLLPSLTQEEVQDLMQDLSGTDINFEDEITDPFFVLSEARS